MLEFCSEFSSRVHSCVCCRSGYICERIIPHKTFDAMSFWMSHLIFLLSNLIYWAIIYVNHAWLKKCFKVCEYISAQSISSEYLMQLRNVGILYDCCFCLRGCRNELSRTVEEYNDQMYFYVRARKTSYKRNIQVN